MPAVETTLHEDIFTILLNRPEKKNAMDQELLDGLYGALKEAESSIAEVVVIRGAGRAFCSGGDIQAFRKAEDPEALIDAEAGVLHEAIKLIRTMGSIVIAAVEGVMVGAGIGLALACDLTIATRNTVMNMGYRRIGLTPDGGGSILLPRIIGAKRFNELYLLSRNVTMEEAYNLGLVNIVCEEEELDQRLTETIGKVRALPMETVKEFKNLVNHALFDGLAVHLDKERIGVSRFANKPLFKQRLDEFFNKKR
jgi:2-(1,2-epoxy-1,2-dihydrophenyl)acetyl-CoA isomerase